MVIGIWAYMNPPHYNDFLESPPASQRQLPNAKVTYIESGVYYCLKHLQRSSFEFVVNVYEEL